MYTIAASVLLEIERLGNEGNTGESVPGVVCETSDLADMRSRNGDHTLTRARAEIGEPPNTVSCAN